VNYHWNWAVFLERTPDGAHSYLKAMLFGAGWTLAVAAAALVIALAAGSVIGVMRTLPSRPAQLAARAWVEVFRNVPLLVQMFVWYFVLPELLPKALGTAIKQAENVSFYTAALCLGLYTSPRIAEQLKAGIQSLRSGQRMAALALGMSLPQAYRLVLLPMAYRIILPPLTSEILGIVKNSAVALTIGLVELTASARSMQEFTFQVFEAFAGATLIYMLINIVIVRSMRLVEQRAAVPGYAMDRRHGH
jgi:glutamate/aspartate transport system permease protein